jgi:predicted transcriptional regulator
MADVVKTERPLTEKMVAILNFLAANEGDHFTSEIAESMDGVTEKQLSPVCTTLVGRGFIAKGEKGVKKVIDKKGLEVAREYNRYHITEAGLEALNQVA